MVLLDRLTGWWASAKAKKGEVFEIASAKAFGNIKSTVREAKEDGTSSGLLRQVDFGLYADGTAVCVGKDAKNPTFIVLPKTESKEAPPLRITTTFQAAGDPENYGLKRLSADQAKIRMAHVNVLDAHYSG